MTLINFSDPRFWVDLLQLMGMVVIALVLFARRPGEEATRATAALESRVLRIEETIKHMATGEELAELDGTVRAVKTTIDALDQRFDTITRQLNRMEDYLMHKGAR